ncbi:hypothetical protein [Actinacidiphila sp. ITFR-21]|uniref:hypothetical protein n=1 Tax=Actinacidiphila sp. ITFR-21 TaxID=3075199 RepID=UPI00288A4F47|nr:hypothetical protein [Streptomyces sp. ITFR-21]WNI20380.1 hypothetical protein RLT57_32775 [Streptomyces sp. ITFR-21]
MDQPELPAPFAALAELAGEPTVERAQSLGRALKAVPDLAAWIREQRRLTVRALLDMPEHSAKTLSGPLGVIPQRVHDIAGGHRASEVAAPELPAVFADLAGLAGEPSVERARSLGEAVKAAPGLTAWIRSRRQRSVRALLDMPQHSAATLSGPLGVTPQRVRDVAAGHRAPENRRRAAARAAIG